MDSARRCDNDTDIRLPFEGQIVLWFSASQLWIFITTVEKTHDNVSETKLIVIILFFHK